MPYACAGRVRDVPREASTGVITGASAVLQVVSLPQTLRARAFAAPVGRNSPQQYTALPAATSYQQEPQVPALSRVRVSPQAASASNVTVFFGLEAVNLDIEFMQVVGIVERNTGPAAVQVVNERLVYEDGFESGGTLAWN